MSSIACLSPYAVRLTSLLLIGPLVTLPIEMQALVPQDGTSPKTYQLPPGEAKPNAKTNSQTGQKVSGGSGARDAEIAGSIAATALLTIGLVHHFQHKQPSPESLMKDGPKVAPNALMNHLIVDGLIGPNWPVGLDFQLESAGNVTLDITTEDKVRYHQVLTGAGNGRGITITRPQGLPDKLQSAVFDVEAIPPPGSNSPPPVLHIYGMAAGPHAVGSIAIDEVSFGPSLVRINQAAQFGFHSHSDFSNVRADFMYSGLQKKTLVMKQDSEIPLNPVASDEHAHGSLQGKGTPGQHLLQIRAWRGNSGDWVVAWSPDVVTLTN